MLLFSLTFHFRNEIIIIVFDILIVISYLFSSFFFKKFVEKYLLKCCDKSKYEKYF